MPLITDSTGKKLGKSYGNALWLDQEKTSSYELYQYILNFEDIMMEEYLKKFTFLEKSQIEDIMEKHFSKPEERLAQKSLAHEVITFLHGEKEYLSAKKISEALFNENINTLSSEELMNSLKEIPHVSLIDQMNIVDGLVETKICSSKREAREMIQAGAISINNVRITDLLFVFDQEKAIDGKLMVIKKGKKNLYLGVFS